MTASDTGIQKSAYDITAMLVSWSKVPETASSAPQSAEQHQRGDRHAARRGSGARSGAKNRPSRAAAYGTRAAVRITPFNEPMVEMRKISAATGAARPPRKVCTARAATDGASG